LVKQGKSVRFFFGKLHFYNHYSHYFDELKIFCNTTIERTLEILESKWTLLLLRELFSGVKRFGELRRSLRPISPKTLTDRLRLLEEQGIVTRTVYSEVPLHVDTNLPSPVKDARVRRS